MLYFDLLNEALIPQLARLASFLSLAKHLFSCKEREGSIAPLPTAPCMFAMVGRALHRRAVERI